MKKEIELIQIIIEVKEEFIKHLGKSKELNAVIDDYKNDISLLNNVLFVLNEKTVNEANRTIDLIDKLKQHSGIRIPYDSKIVADWLLNQL